MALSAGTLFERIALSRLASGPRRLLSVAGTLAGNWTRALARWAALQFCRVSTPEPDNPLERVWERWTAAAANLCVTWGWGKTRGQGGDDVARLVRRSAEGRAILGKTGLDPADAGTLVQLQESEVLRPLVWEWLRDHRTGLGAVADWVHQQVVLNGPAAIGDEATGQCLRVIPEIASILSQTQASELARVLAALAAAPTDPYQPVVASSASRAGLAELLATRPELDEVLIPSGADANSQIIRASLRALATGIHRETTHRASRFSRACTNASLDRDSILDLAATASPARVRGLRREKWTRLPGVRNWLRRSAVATLAWLVPVLFGAGLLAVFWAYPPELLERVTLEVTMAAFALIATVHALIITLSREHLPRRMARIAATPQILVSAYVTSMIGIIASAIDLRSQPGLTAEETETWTDALNALAAASVLVSVALLAASSFRVLRLSDPVAATTAFGRAGGLRVGRAGSRFGRAQARSLELTNLFAALPNVQLSPELMPGEVAHVIRAESRGLFVPDKRSVRRLVMCNQFEAGMSLRVMAPLGQVVARLDPVLALVPTSTQRMAADTSRRGKAVAELSGIGWLDHTGGVIASLFDLAVRICREGDQGGAQRAASTCLDLAFRHLSKMAVARSRAYELARVRAQGRSRGSEWRPARAAWQPPDPSTSRETPPASPVIVDLVDSCVRSLSSQVGAERDIALYVLNGLIAHGTREDRLPTVVTRALATASPVRFERVPLHLQLLRRCALGSLELDLRDEFVLVVESMLRLPFGKPEQVVDEVTTALAAAARIDADAAEQILQRFLTDKRHDADSRFRTLFSVGAAALDAGALRLAVICVEELSRSGRVAPDQDWLDMEGRLIEPGSFLGNSPRNALAQFESFAIAVDSLL